MYTGKSLAEKHAQNLKASSFAPAGLQTQVYNSRLTAHMCIHRCWAPHSGPSALTQPCGQRHKPVGSKHDDSDKKVSACTETEASGCSTFCNARLRQVPHELETRAFKTGAQEEVCMLVPVT